MIFYNNKNTNKKRGKSKNWKKQFGITKMNKPGVSKVLLLNYGIIWNSMKYECGGGGVNHFC